MWSARRHENQQCPTVGKYVQRIRIIKRFAVIFILKVRQPKFFKSGTKIPI